MVYGYKSQDVFSLRNRARWSLEACRRQCRDLAGPTRRCHQRWSSPSCERSWSRTAQRWHRGRRASPRRGRPARRGSRRPSLRTGGLPRRSTWKKKWVIRFDAFRLALRFCLDSSRFCLNLFCSSLLPQLILFCLNPSCFSSVHLVLPQLILFCLDSSCIAWSLDSSCFI